MYTIKKTYLTYLSWKVEAFIFLPKKLSNSNTLAIFTHGYTSHKGSLISWGHKLANASIPALIFDLPGHYLGSFNEVESFEEFECHAHELFLAAYQQFSKICPELSNISAMTTILGGHSLGALLALKALGMHEFSQCSKLGIAVGYGLQDDYKSHTLEGPFFKDVLTTRSQLVSQELSPEKLFPWVAKSKQDLEILGHDIFLITGKDDYVVGTNGLNNIKKLLEKDNRITTIVPPHLPHHQPELAATHIRSLLKKTNLI